MVLTGAALNYVRKDKPKPPRATVKKILVRREGKIIRTITGEK